MTVSSENLLHETANSYLYVQDEPGFPMPVVVKILKAEFPSPQRIIQFNNEFEFTKNLELPGIRKAFGSQKREGKHTLLLEYVVGETLRDAFLRRRQLPEPPTSKEEQQPLETFLKTAIAIAEALRQVHEQGIIHKDINPNNILVDLPSGKVTIIDFGISTKIDLKTQHLGNPEKLEGTLAYLSPEQSGRMNRITDYRTDFYSLGVTFYELLTGKLPFDTQDSLELVHCHIARTPLPLHQLNPNVPPVLSEIVSKLMAKNAEDRYQSAFGLKSDLQKCLSEWQLSGKIERFELGKDDFSGRFQIPQKLYGREMETAALLAAFARTVHGGLEMMIVSGYSGVGKSALVHEIHKPITERRGYFISGKYDQYQRNVPYFALRQAFNEFYNLQLTENLDTLERLKTNILEAVGTNAAVLFDLMPHLETLIGEQPPVEKLEAKEAAARFQLVFQKFLRVISTVEHPLVIFIDDLQWADNASLNLLKSLLTDDKNCYLLLIGAYRDNETDPTHPLMVMLEEVQREGATLNNIRLKPLSIQHVKELVSDALHWDNMPPKSNPEAAGGSGEPQFGGTLLAKIVYDKTGGNAFFTVEFLKALNERRLVWFDYERQTWQAGIEAIRRLEASDNVVDLMAGKIKTLPPETQTVLRLAACIGNRFDLKMLAVIFEKNLQETLAALWKAVEEGLVVPLDDRYKLLAVELQVQEEISFKFIHDRVQQAAYSLIGEGQRKATHLKIGTLLLRSAGSKQFMLSGSSLFTSDVASSAEKCGESDTLNVVLPAIFDIVNHLNLGRALISDPMEKTNLARLNLLAGQKAKDASAFRSALEYLETGLRLLRKNAWNENYDLTLALYKTTAEVEYLNGKLETSEELILACLDHARTPAEKADIYYVLMLRQSLSSQYQEAIETARKGLSLLGFDLPSENLEQHVGEQMGWLVGWFQEHGIESIFSRPDLSDPVKLATLKILDNVSMPAYVGGHVQLWILHVLLKVRLSIEQGNAPETGYAFSELGLIFCIFGNFGYAFPCADLSRRIVEKFEQQSLRHKSRAFHLIANYISPWRMHYPETEPINNESYRTSLDSGELIFTGYTLFHPFYNHFYAGSQPLSELLRRIPANLNFAKKIKHDLAVNSIRAMRMFLLNLMDEAGDEMTFISPAATGDDWTEERFLEQCTTDRDYYSICIYYVFKAKILYLYDRCDKALQALEAAKPMIAVLSGHAASLATYHFTKSLVLLALTNPAGRNLMATHKIGNILNGPNGGSNYPRSSNPAGMKQGFDTSPLREETVEARTGSADIPSSWNEIEAMTQVADSQWLFKTWAENCPANFEHKYLLVEAERARVEGRDFEAVWFYNEAVRTAHEWGAVQEEALANELAARFLLSKNVPHYAQPHFREARLGYVRWGALRKARLLEQRFPVFFAQKTKSGTKSLLETHTSIITTQDSSVETSTGELDFQSITKASQAFSGEIVLEKLFAKLIKIVLENAGAQKAVLALNSNGKWEFPVSYREGESEPLLEFSTENGEQIPSSVFHFLQNTRQPLVLDNAQKDNRFVADPYIVRHKPKSVLGMPLIHQGELVGILYLENNLTSGAFTPDRVQTLQVLSSPMAISLRNAQLYHHLNELNKAYARFIPREFLRTLGRESILDVRLGDQSAQQMTVLFSDIRDYTTLSESMTPEQNFNFINGYLRRISPCIQQNGGFINQFLGDGIMAIFAEAQGAVQAAIGMQQSLNEYNLDRQASGRQPIKMGIGIHTGGLMLGIIGDQDRHNVGVISDVVNSASRIEGLTKTFGVNILISESVLAEIKQKERFNYRFLGRVQVKGKHGILPVYEFYDGDEEASARLKLETSTLFKQALEEYFNRQFAEAALYLKKVNTLNPADRVAEHYLKRAARYLLEGVETVWTGVEKMEEK